MGELVWCLEEGTNVGEGVKLTYPDLCSGVWVLTDYNLNSEEFDSKSM